MKKYLPILLLGLITAAAIVTRFYKLGSVPSGLYVDEAGQGYSAYSILKTGKDEFGKVFPIVFRSMTDFRTPIYTYLIVPLIPIFGLNMFTVRFPSFFFGVLTIPLVYLLVKELSGKNNLALMAALLFSISPWHILFSKTAYETNIALFFLIFGLFLFYKALKKPVLLLASASMLAVSVTAYQSERVFIPLILIALLYKYREILFKKSYRVYIIAGSIVGFICLLPTLSVALTPGFWARASGLNIFSHIKQMPDGYIAAYNGILSGIINGSWFLSIREFFWHYFSYFSPRYMFLLGDYDTRISFPELSTFFLWQFPFYIYGLWLLFKRKNLGKLRFFTITSLLISPIAAAVTRDPYSTIRAFLLVIPQIIIISIAIEDVFLKLKRDWLRKLSSVVFVFLIIYSLLKLYSSVVILNDYYRAKYWNWGWQEVAQEITNLHTTNPIIVDNARGDVYLQLAFFLKYNPDKYQNENFEVPLNEYYTNIFHTSEKHIGNITTRPINWQKDLLVDQYLVGDELAISLQQIEVHKLSLISQINYPDGSPAYRIVRTNSSFAQEEQRLFNSHSSSR